MLSQVKLTRSFSFKTSKLTPTVHSDNFCARRYVKNLKVWGRWLRDCLRWTSMRGHVRYITEYLERLLAHQFYLCACINSERCSFLRRIECNPLLWLLAQTPTVCRFHADTRVPSNRKPLTARLPRRPHLKEPPPSFRWTAVYITGYTDSQLTSSVCPLPLTPVWLSGIVLGDLTWLVRGPAAEWIGRRMCYTRSVNEEY